MEPNKNTDIYRSANRVVRELQFLKNFIIKIAVLQTVDRKTAGQTGEAGHKTNQLETKVRSCRTNSMLRNQFYKTNLNN
jgi:hypothetical protein